MSALKTLKQGNHHLDLVNASRDILSSGSSIAKASDIPWVLNTYASDMKSDVREMFLCAISSAGFAGRIVVEKSRSDVSSIEIIKGYTFETSPSWHLTVKLDKPRVICIDGFIESVSEIHHFLEASSEAKEPVLMFVRGLHDDVKNTLKVNFDRGSLVVIPIIVPFDLSGMNTLKDVSIACGCNLVSNLSGELISSITYSGLSSIDSASLYHNKVVLMNKKSRRSVAAHVKDLRSRRDDQNVDDVAKLLDNRIRSLSPNHVVIRLSDDKDFITKSQSIDYALRALRSLIDYGTISYEGKKQLTATVVASSIHAKKCINMLSSVGAILA